NVHAKKAENINRHLSEWLSKFPRHFFKSITFDNGKEFAGWREIANQFDIHTYFAEVGAPNQRGLNENNNGLLRRDGLTKDRDLRNLPDELVNQLMSKRNRIPGSPKNKGLGENCVFSQPLVVFPNVRQW
ncbi:IS30 family transposase, partial [Limosilactobacillus fermentum]